MIIIEFILDSDILEFKTGQHVSIYVNEEQTIMVRVPKLIGRNNFNILYNKKKLFVKKVNIIYRK